MVTVSMEQHMHIKFCATLEKAGAEMYQMTKTAFWEEAVSHISFSVILPL
jgi:hypothetical protein